MLFQKGFQLIVLFVHWLDKNKTQIETQHQSKKGCCKNETCLLRAIMATSTIALPQGRMKWSNCRVTKNPDYKLSWAILLSAGNQIPINAILFYVVKILATLTIT